jgi:hypothetical protein
VIEGIRLSGSHRIEAVAPAHRAVVVEVGAEPGRLARTVHLALPSALGAFTVESDPPGAELRVDGKLLGRTPFTVTDVTVDERHRIDLALPGHDVDQFVVLPEKDGNRFVRKLVPRPRGPG